MKRSIWMCLAWSWASSAWAADADAGRALYMSSCMACHGVKADGKGPAAAALKPAPSDFTSADFWADRDDASIKVVVKACKPGTSMMAFPGLSDAQLDDVVAYLRTLAPAE